MSDMERVEVSNKASKVDGIHTKSYCVQDYRRLARYVSTKRCAGNVGCSCPIFELNCGINSKWAIFELCHFCIQ